MTKDTMPAERPVYLAFLPAFLFRAEGSRLLYILKAWALVLAASLLLSISVKVAVPAAQGPELPVSGAVMVGLITVVGPFVETLMMAAVLLILRRFVGFGPAVLLSSLGWGLAHSWGAPTWGLVAWWPFLIFSIAFLTWRSRGTWSAILMVTAIHALQNSFAVGLLLLGPRLTSLH